MAKNVFKEENATYDLFIQNIQQNISVKGQNHDFSLTMAAILENGDLFFYIESTLYHFPTSV